MVTLENFINSISGVVLFDEPLSKHTNFRIGGPAQILVIPHTVKDIQQSIKYAKQNNLRIHVIGNGSKLLIADNGLSGLTLKINENFGSIFICGDKLIADAGIQLSRLLSLATSHSLKGLEFAAGIPATLGGAIVMNAGTYLGSISDVISTVNAIDLDSGLLISFSNNECKFKYRDSIFRRKSLIVTSAEIVLKSGDKESIQKTIKDLLKIRADTQPLDKPNAGSIFKNPKSFSAGKLIDQAKLKGFKNGQAEISEKHGNFIVNHGGAKAEDVLFLIKKIQSIISENYGVELELELVVLSDDLK